MGGGGERERERERERTLGQISKIKIKDHAGYSPQADLGGGGAVCGGDGLDDGRVERAVLHRTPGLVGDLVVVAVVDRRVIVLHDSHLAPAVYE